MAVGVPEQSHALQGSTAGEIASGHQRNHGEKGKSKVPRATPWCREVPVDEDPAPIWSVHEIPGRQVVVAYDFERPDWIAAAVRPFEPVRGGEALHRIMEAANRGDDLGERGVRDKEAVMVGVDAFALDVVKYLAPLVVDRAQTRRVEPLLLQVAQKDVNARRLGASRPMNRVIDSQDRFVGVAA